MSFFETLYKASPVLVQHIGVSSYGYYWRWLRFGRGYKSSLDEYNQRERFTEDQWMTWQKKELTRLLSTAAEYVPFYRDSWSQLEKKAARSGRLEELPLTVKDDLRANPEAFLREDIDPGRRMIFHTSGSTGTPVKSIWTIPELRSSMALREARSARWAHVSFSLPRATFSGRFIEPQPESKGPFYRYNHAERQVYLSAFHLQPCTASAYVAALRKHSIQWLTGYAVSFYHLALFILEQRLDVPVLKTVITTSEKLTAEMREVMEAAYNCPVFQEYSTVENVIFANECQFQRLHVSPDVGVVEILRYDGSVCDPGELGEIVATAIMRDYQPLIRYKLGDLGAWDLEPCPCGRQMSILKEIVGRVEDVIISPDGRQMVRFHGVFTDQPGVREGQIIQESLNHIRVKIVPTEFYTKSDEQDIIKKVQQRLGPHIAVSVECVPEIPRTSAGKYRAVVSNLPKAEREQVHTN